MRRLAFCLGIVALGFVQTACTNETSMRVIHAAPGAGPVDVYIRGVSEPLISNLSYEQVSELANIETGTRVFEIRPAGAASTTTPVYTSEPVSLEKDIRVTLVAAGVLGSTQPAEAFRLMPLVEQFGARQSGQARVRIVHAGVDAPAVNLDVGNDGSIELTNLQRFTATEAEGVLLAANQPVQLGLLAGNTPVTAYTLPSLPEFSEVFVVAGGRVNVDSANEQALVLIAASEQERLSVTQQHPVFFALHASPDAPAVDIFVGTKELVSNIDFSQLSTRVQVPPGAYTLDFLPAQAGTTRPTVAPAATVTTPQLQAGRSYLIAATGLVAPAAGEKPFQLATFDRSFAIDPQNARLRAVHLSVDAPAVDVGLITGTFFNPIPGLTNLTFPNASSGEGVSLPPSALTLGLAPTGTTTPVARFAQTVQAGQSIFAIAAGVLTPSGTRKTLRLINVDATSTSWTSNSLPPL